jgi:non-ribosomal peptide synthetase component E (peptide arylation enzyme)
VIGFPNADGGEMACAVVVTSDHMIDVRGVAQFLSDFGMTCQKIPERVEIVDTLHRNSSCKVDKNELWRK